MIYLYCLAAAGNEPVAGQSGLGGQPVRAMTVGPIVAWVSELARGPIEVTTELARTHDAVVRAAMAIETPLPARFGQGFSDEAALERSLDERREALVRALDRVRGALEMTVRVLLGDARAPGEAYRARPAAAESGRAYLARLRERDRADAQARQQAEFLQRQLSRAVRGVVREEARAPALRSPRLSRAFAVSHLVDRGTIAQYRHAVHAFIESEPGLRVMMSGPWAPYSFAELSGA